MTDRFDRAPQAGTADGEFDISLVRRLHREVGERLEAMAYEAGSERQAALAAIADRVREHSVGERMGSGQPPLEPDQEQRLARAIEARMFGAGQLQLLIEDDTIEDININAYDEVFVVRAGGGKERVEPVASSDEELIEMVQTLATYSGLNPRPFDAANPELDLRLPDGSRLSATMGGVAEHPTVAIRRNRFGEKISIEELEGLQTITEEQAEFLNAIVEARHNVMIAGATSAGKTTTLRALASAIDPAERIITVERALELGLRKFPEQHPDCVEFEERLANSEAAGAVTMAQLVRRSLRMSPDRVVVGEVLGPEIVTMLNAMTQGNDGSLSTIHARTSLEVFNRISTYALQSEERIPREATLSLVAGGLDFVLFLRRDRGTGTRRMSSIREITGFDGGQVTTSELFTSGRTGHARWNPDVTDVMRADDLRDVGWRPPTDARWR